MKNNTKNKIYNQFNINNNQFIVPFPAVSAMITILFFPLNSSPFMNMNVANESATPDIPPQSTSSDTQSQHSLSKYNNIKSEPNDNTPPQRVQLPQFLGSVNNNSFPPVPSQQYQTVSTYPIYVNPLINQLQQQQLCDSDDIDNKDNIIKQSPNRNRNISANISPNNSIDNKENKCIIAHTPPPNKLNNLSLHSRTSHENSVVFTPANHKNSCTISTNSNGPEQIHTNKSPAHKRSIHLPGNVIVYLMSLQ